MTRLSRIAADVPIIVIVVALFFGRVHISFLNFLSFGDLNLISSSTIKMVLFVVLIVFLLVDFNLFGAPQHITAPIVFVLTALIFQNWALGIFFGLVDFLVISFIP